MFVYINLNAIVIRFILVNVKHIGTLKINTKSIISKIKLMKTSLNSYYARRVLENNHCIDFDHKQQLDEFK